MNTAIITPVIAAASNTAELLADLLTKQKKEIEETMRLITSLKDEYLRLDAELERELALNEQDEAILLLNEKVAALTKEINALLSAPSVLEKQLAEAKKNFKDLTDRNTYLHTEAGLRERAEPVLSRIRLQQLHQELGIL